MSLATRCPGCQATLKVDERSVGRRVRCPKCRHAFPISSITFDGGATEQATETMSPATVAPSDTATESAAQSESRRPPQPATNGQTFGRFELKMLLGQGTYGKVYRAFDPVLDREIALKIPKFSGDRSRVVERFLREAKAAARLRHPNIVGVFESGRVGEDYYMASEFVDGQTLEDAIKNGPIDPTQAATWCRDLSDGLAYAHEAGIVHRDIKPGNVLIDKTGRPQIADFGLAKRVGEDATMTTEGSLLGTPAYMSPEQARGETDRIGPASDQYSLGAVFYELLCGKRPFEGSPHAVIAKAAGHEQPPAPRSIRPMIPRDLEAICLRSIEKEPGRRYLNARKMSEDLQRWLEGQPVRTRRISPVERLFRWCKRNPVLAASLTVTAGVILAAIGGAFTRVIVQLEQTQQVAQDAQRTAKEETLAAQAAKRQLAINEFERGRKLCEEGELTQGLLWLSSSLANLTPEMSDLDRPIRLYIGSWLPYVHQLRTVIPHEKRVNSVAIHPNGTLVLTGSGKEVEPGVAQLWNLQTGDRVGEPIAQDKGVAQVKFSSDGQRFATAGFDKTVRIVETATGRVLQTLTHPDEVWSVGFSQDGNQIATGCADEYARIWNVETGTPIGAPLHHPRAHPQQAYNIAHNRRPTVQQVAFSPDGKQLATSTYDRRVRVWNLATGQVQAGPVQAKQNWYFPLAFHPSGEKLLTQIEVTNPVGAQFRDARTLAPIGPTYKHRDYLMSVKCSDNGQMVLTAGEVATRIWDAETGEQRGQALLHSTEVYDACFSRDQKIVATAGTDHVVRIWDLAEQVVEGHEFKNLNSGAGVMFLPDGQTFLTSDLSDPNQESGAPSRVRFWDCKTGNQVGGPFLHGGMTNSFAVTADRSVYARGYWQGTELIRVDTGASMDPLNLPDRARTVVWTNDDSILVSGCQDSLIRFWDREKKVVIEPSLKHEKQINKLEFSPGYNLLMSITGETLRLWDWKARKQVGPDIKPPVGISWASFHPDGKVVATSGNDGSVRFWNVPDGTEMQRLVPNVNLPSYVQFTPDGKTVITSSRDGSTRFWDFETCLPCARPLLRAGRTMSTDINRDGSLLVTGGSDPVVRLYEMPKSIEGSAVEVRRKLERLLGAELNSRDQVRVLETDEWKRRADTSGQKTTDRI